MSTPRRADVVVLGGGSAGYAAAIRLRELGRSVIVVERDALGGTCLHRGCVPTKAMLHIAEVADEIRHAPALGLVAELSGIDGARIAAFRDGIVAGKHKGLTGLLASHGVEIVHGTGTLVPGGVLVDGESIEAPDVVIATGAVSRTLGIEIGGRVLTSDEALALYEVPSSVIVIGGGVIGVEFASLWRSLGAEVTVVEAAERLVPGEDAASSKALERAFRKRGIAVRSGIRFDSVAAGADAATVTLEGGETLTAAYALIAVGRAPALAGLGLDQAGVRVEGGCIVVDDALRTSAPGVWAAGDVVAGLQLAHRGFMHGIHVAEQIAGREPRAMPEFALPRVTYSDPEIASVGLTQTEAEATHGAARIAVSEYNLAGNAKSEILGTAGFAKVVRLVDGPIIGVHLVGRRVGELISEAQLVVGWEAHPEDIAPFVHAHPTQSEALGEAFLSLSGSPLHGRQPTTGHAAH